MGGHHSHQSHDGGSDTIDDPIKKCEHVWHLDIGHTCLEACDKTKLTGIFGAILGDVNITPGVCEDGGEELVDTRSF